MTVDIFAIRLAGNRLGHFHVGENNRRVPGKGGLDWYRIGEALRSIGYDGSVVMEPFVQMGGGIGSDIKVWRDMSHGDHRQIIESVDEVELTFIIIDPYTYETISITDPITFKTKRDKIIYSCRYWAAGAIRTGGPF